MPTCQPRILSSQRLSIKIVQRAHAHGHRRRPPSTARSDRRESSKRSARSQARPQSRGRRAVEWTAQRARPQRFRSTFADNTLSPRAARRPRFCDAAAQMRGARMKRTIYANATSQQTRAAACCASTAEAWRRLRTAVSAPRACVRRERIERRRANSQRPPTPPPRRRRRPPPPPTRRATRDAHFAMRDELVAQAATTVRRRVHARASKKKAAGRARRGGRGAHGERRRRHARWPLALITSRRVPHATRPCPRGRCKSERRKRRRRLV